MALRTQHATLARRASRLRLAARTVAISMKTGSFRSLYRAQGIDFAGVREYLAGDDVRSIDWNVTARLDKPFVKLYEEERELAVFLVIDCSRSMFTCGHRQTAFEAAALLALAAEQTHGAVGALLFDGEVKSALLPKPGQAMTILSRLDDEAAVPEERPAGTALGTAIRGAAKLLKKRSLVFVISDFRAALWEKPLQVLALKHDVAAIRITAPLDAELPPVGLLPLVDPETGERRLLPISRPAFRRAWQEDHRRHLEAWQESCTTGGAVPMGINTAEDPAERLRVLLGKR
ncbi:MAG: DUF58 domain-containing protein [Spirochaetaceae bacterium]|jgi:uncharacterized protein (DUF58 family)|nr:DUF58 domain-containing protein [Spirochaetaceae bacterium]